MLIAASYVRSNFVSCSLVSCSQGRGEGLGTWYNFIVGPFLSIFKYHVTLGPVSDVISLSLSLSDRRPVRRACKSVRVIYI